MSTAFEVAITYSNKKKPDHKRILRGYGQSEYEAYQTAQSNLSHPRNWTEEKVESRQVTVEFLDHRPDPEADEIWAELQTTRH